MIDEYGYINGYVERKEGGAYLGSLNIEGIALSPIQGVYFTDEGNNYLWLKRKRVLEYDAESQTYKEREASPKWEAYLKKEIDGSVVAYKGEFNFLRFRFSIVGVWDRVLGTDKKQRLNLFVERLPMGKQTIINSINDRKREDSKTERP